MGVLVAILMFVLRWLFAWVVCPWCGQVFPFWGKATYGPREPWHCKRCGREI